MTEREARPLELKRPAAVSLRAIGIVAVVVGVVTAIGMYVTDPRIALLLAIAHSQQLPVSEYVSAGAVRLIPWLLATALATWVAYRLWRLALGGPGARELLFAFVATGVSLGASVVAMLVLYATASARLSAGAVAWLLLFWVFVPGLFGLVAVLVMAPGLLRAGLATRWIALVGIAYSVLSGVVVALTAGATWNAFLPGASSFLRAIQRLAAASSGSAALAVLASGLYALFWVALGTGLYSRGADEMDLPDDDGKRP
jgi:hypothetical protein